MANGYGSLREFDDQYDAEGAAEAPVEAAVSVPSGRKWVGRIALFGALLAMLLLVSSSVGAYPLFGSSAIASKPVLAGPSKPLSTGSSAVEGELRTIPTLQLAEETDLTADALRTRNPTPVHFPRTHNPTPKALHPTEQPTEAPVETKTGSRKSSKRMTESVVEEGEDADLNNARTRNPTPINFPRTHNPTPKALHPTEQPTEAPVESAARTRKAGKVMTETADEDQEDESSLRTRNPTPVHFPRTHNPTPKALHPTEQPTEAPVETKSLSRKASKTAVEVEDLSALKTRNPTPVHFPRTHNPTPRALHPTEAPTEAPVEAVRRTGKL
jgi:hypothetical protein